MPLLKKIIIAIVSIIILVIILNYGVSYYITQKLPSIIHAEKDFPYNISYEDLDINLLSGSLTIHNAAIAPKGNMASEVNRSGVYGLVKKIKVEHFNLWALLRKDRINVKRIIIDTPEITLYDRKKKYNMDDDLVKPFKNTINTQSIELTKGKFIMLDSVEKIKLKSQNIALEFNNIKVDSTTIKNNLPVKYSTYSLKCDSLFYQISSMYHLSAGKLATTDSTLTIDDFRFIPELSKVQFARTIPKEKDQYRVSINKVTIPKSDWGFFRDTLYVHAPKVTLDNVNANIYRPKMPADDFTTKKLYSQLLRELKFDLKIDTLLLKDSFLQYEEQLEYSKPAAKVSFSKFYATISNLYSPVNKSDFPVTMLDVQCLFMKSASLKVNWTFKIMDESDAFTIKGNLQNVKSKVIDPVAKPLMNITTTGDLNKVIFTFNGNRNTSNGTFAIDYDDLKVELYKKDGKKKNELMSAVGNMLVKNDSKGNLKQTDVSVERVKHKSVFNFLWRFLQEGLKKTLLPKFMSKEDKK